MTPAQIATNSKALRNLAARLERLGYGGDAYSEAEHIAMNLLADGFRPVEPPVPDRPERVASAEVRRQALAAAKAAVDEARRNRAGRGEG